ncbi:C2 domain [Pseudocohnilembus persalinus]|uniref:C2 domain n=1 Tax=Pseudocohnilembus persalinus TaxID=266149 RepID=A0A0V0QJ57_PSEPJ|nr:C2 domain [Pseudocohnilembus persalinus]|eukprot:KRX02198.1 C2 domain [Pseudocohnilembus persalinus]
MNYNQQNFKQYDYENNIIPQQQNLDNQSRKQILENEFSDLIRGKLGQDDYFSQQEILDFLDRKREFSENKLLVEIIEAIKLEPLVKNGQVDPFVKIICGNSVYNTEVLLNTNNPRWNQTFDIKLDSSVQEIIFVVTDKERALRNEDIGCLRISLDELQDQHKQEKFEHLVKQNSGFRVIKKNGRRIVKINQ